MKKHWTQFNDQEVKDMIKNQLLLDGMKVSEISFVDDDHVLVDIGRLGAKVKFTFTGDK